MYYNTIFRKSQQRGVKGRIPALGRSLIPVLAACLLLTALAGCSAGDAEAKQACVSAYEAMKEQTEAHFTTYTLEGLSPDDLTGQSRSEYWISGENWLYHHAPEDSPGIWQLCRDGKHFSAGDSADGSLQWQESESNMAPAAVLPELDFEQLRLESAERHGAELVAIFSAEDATDGNLTVSSQRIVFTIDESGALEELRYSMKHTFPGDDGEETELWQEIVFEYTAFQPGEVTEQVEAIQVG